MNKQLSVIIINYNNETYTIECLKSLCDQNYNNFEVLIVDNASESHNFQNLQNQIKTFESKLDLRIIRNKYNLHFAGANNVGLKNANGQYICLLNNDTELESDVFEKIIPYLEKNNKVGMLCPKIMIYNKKDYIWYAGAFLDSKSPYFTYHIGLNQKDFGQFNQVKETAYANGASLFTRKDVINKIGFLDEIYFMYVEEADWNYRAKKFGYKIIYFPKVKVYHKIPLISKKTQFGYRENAFQIYLYTRNKIIFTLKHFSPKQIAQFFMFHQFKTMIFEIVYAFINKKPEFLLALLRATFFGIIIGLRRRLRKKCRNLLRSDLKYISKYKKYRN